jgi:hypothetical protein
MGVIGKLCLIFEALGEPKAFEASEILLQIQAQNLSRPN